MRQKRRSSILAVFTAMMTACSTFAQEPEIQTSEKNSVAKDDSRGQVKAIEQLLQKQVDAWNDGNIEKFMETYWKSPQLTFSSGGKTTRGWKATLDQYKRNYPAEKMGRLSFDDLETTLLAGGNVALVLGKWHLKPNNSENRDGNFSLVLVTQNKEWKIIHDHSSSLDKPKQDVEGKKIHTTDSVPHSDNK